MKPVYHTYSQPHNVLQQIYLSQFWLPVLLENNLKDYRLIKKYIIDKSWIDKQILMWTVVWNKQMEKICQFQSILTMKKLTNRNRYFPWITNITLPSNYHSISILHKHPYRMWPTSIFFPHSKECIDCVNCCVCIFCLKKNLFNLEQYLWNETCWFLMCNLCLNAWILNSTAQCLSCI